MSYQTLLFFAVLLVIAGLPAYAMARMPGLRAHRPWKKALVLIGTTIGLLPLSMVLALIVMFQVFGIDMID